MDFSNLHKFIKTDANSTPLTLNMEKEMIRQYQQNGDSSARDRLIESNIRFVVKMALNYKNKGMSLPDLIQEGNLGLIEAIDRFDPEKKCRLITYASWWIRLRMQRSIEQKANQVNLPINKLDQFRKVCAFKQAFEARTGRLPHINEIANALALTEKKVRELLESEITFQTLHGRDEEHPGYESILEDEDSINPREGVWNQEVDERLHSAFAILTERERDVLAHRYRIHDGGQKKMSLRKVGQMLGLSAEGVRRIEEQAMSKLRRPSIMAKMESLFAT
ncbi:sigma-70 family RNA polymerase sigma factor [bacterium]|nr:sigma-70 family RNA polymerase sigma factor [bacterium]